VHKDPKVAAFLRTLQLSGSKFEYVTLSKSQKVLYYLLTSSELGYSSVELEKRVGEEYDSRFDLFVPQENLLI
jgi:predicted transposase YdaD